MRFGTGVEALQKQLKHIWKDAIIFEDAGLSGRRNREQFSKEDTRMAMTEEEKAEREKAEREKACKEIPYTTAAEEKGYIFVSYKSDDWKPVLIEIIKPLQKNYHLRFYYDKAFDHDKGDWIEQMKEHMSTPFCRGVLCFISRAYMSSCATLLELLMSCSQDVRDCCNKSVLPVIPIILPHPSSSGEKSKAIWNFREEIVKRSEQISMTVDEKQTMKEIIGDIIEYSEENNGAEIPKAFVDRIKKLRGKMDKAKLGTSGLKTRDVAWAFYEFFDGKLLIEKYADNDTEFLEKIRDKIKSIAGGVSVFDEHDEKTVPEHPTEESALLESPAWMTDLQKELNTYCPTAPAFRDDQMEVLRDVLEGKCTLLIRKTGWGKNLVYFAAAKLLRYGRIHSAGSLRCLPPVGGAEKEL